MTVLICTHGILLPKEDGGQFYGALGDLKVSSTSGGLSQMEGFKVFHTFGGDNRIFSTGGIEGVPPPLAKNLLFLPQ